MMRKRKRSLLALIQIGVMMTRHEILWGELRGNLEFALSMFESLDDSDNDDSVSLLANILKTMEDLERIDG